MIKLCVCVTGRRRRGRRRRRRTRSGIQNQKQEPHTKMWGTVVFLCFAKVHISDFPKIRVIPQPPKSLSCFTSAGSRGGRGQHSRRVRRGVHPAAACYSARPRPAAHGPGHGRGGGQRHSGGKEAGRKKARTGEP